MNTEALLLRHDHEGVVTLTLNRPAQFNALSTELLEALQGELDKLGADGTARVVVIAGAGKAFCAGHDLKQMRAHHDKAYMQRLFKQCGRVMTMLTELPQPTIARVQGIATAAGCQLVATCDLAIAAEDARFATPGVNIGLFCSTPMVALSRAVASKHAMEMLLTGDMIGAAEAQRIGLINRAVPPAELGAATMALARKIAAKSIYTLKTGKGAFYRQVDMDLKHAYDYAAHIMTENMQSVDAAEGIDAFLQKRHPTWQDC